MGRIYSRSVQLVPQYNLLAVKHELPIVNVGAGRYGRVYRSSSSSSISESDNPSWVWTLRPS